MIEKKGTEFKKERRNVMKRMKKLTLWMAAFAAMLLMTGMVAWADVRYQVKVDSGYLALRTAKAYDSRNEIGKLYTGELVSVSDTSDSTYWYVYSLKLGMWGYVNKNYLIAVSSDDYYYSYSDDDWTVSIDSGYLALRSSKAYDSANEIGKLYSGDVVTVKDDSDPIYWYVYSSKLKRTGFVNKDYLVQPDVSLAESGWTVSVQSGYLALRTAKAYDSRNEIGKLYNGDWVIPYDMSDSTYWYVYSPTLGKYGYVNRNYLLTPSYMVDTMTVRVDSGYLALRNAKAYDYSNEIGKLYTGDTVQVENTSDSTYWYVYSPKLDLFGFVNKNYLY